MDARSVRILYSATAERFPVPTAPPMKTNSFTASSRSGNAETNSAMFVIGPLDTMVTFCPAPPFHVSLMHRAIPSMARTCDPSSLKANNACTCGSFPSGRPMTPPSPSDPCISGSCLGGSSRGFTAPGKTRTCSGAAKACKQRAALSAVHSLEAFPWVWCGMM